MKAKTITDLSERFDLPAEEGVTSTARAITAPVTASTTMPEVTQIVSTLQGLGYRVASNDSKDLNLNIVGIRSDGGTANSFDDQIWVFWKFRDRWQLRKYKATTDPGSYWLMSPERVEGTAILKEGQYLGSHRLGKHRNRYEALVQAKPVTVIRDFNRDNTLDYASGREQTGFFGINIHRANEQRPSMRVDKWSAGCQVFSDPVEYGDFISLCKQSIPNWGNSFSYTLIRKSQMVP